MKQDLSRRTFLTKGAAIGAAAATSGAALATPAIAQELPTLRWRLTSGFRTIWIRSMAVRSIWPMPFQR
jgi:TRAP-type mannitol/chloroaromatic compound transport system substrate-binding protein